MQRASQIIGRISTNSKRTKASDPLLDPEQVACAAWARAVGKKVTQHTRAAKLVRGRLIVEVEDAAWQRNLFFLSKQILRNLEGALGQGIVEDIEFRVLPPRREPQRAALSMAAGAVAPAPDESESVQDPGLRRLYRAARKREIA